MGYQEKYQAQLDRAKIKQQRRQQALSMQQEGKSLKQIGEALEVSRERARQLVAEAIAENAEVSRET